MIIQSDAMRVLYCLGIKMNNRNYSDAVCAILAGGDKRSQAADIKTALDLASKLKEIEK